MIIAAPVQYRGADLLKITEFEKKPAQEKVGAYWDEKGDVQLVAVKKTIKDYYLNVQDFKCAYCRQQIEVSHNAAWDTDHIISKDTHPQFMFESRNLCVSCKDCNGLKSKKVVLRNPKRKRFPTKGSDYDFVHPHFHTYSDHIRVVKLAALYLPRTALGVKLIEVCGLLRFVLKFADYGCAGREDSAVLLDLATELQDSKSATEQVAIMSVMSSLLNDKLNDFARASVKNRIKVV